MSREKLSAVVVVRDESRQLRECLRALRFADEIVVVDCGSTDGTVEIARELADRVILYPGAARSPAGATGEPPPLIHAAKNFAFDEAAGPWILNLDADERPTDALRDEVLKTLEAPPREMGAYTIPFTHYFFGRYLRHGGFRGRLVRLFRKGRLLYPEDRAHSTPVVAGGIGSLQNLVVHFNHPRISDFLRKMDLYTSQDAPLMARHGRGGLRNRAARDPGVWTFVRGPLGVFWNRYVLHRGFLDGVHGLVAAALLAAYQFFETAKLWEFLHQPPEAPAGGAVGSSAGKPVEDAR